MLTGKGSGGLALGGKEGKGEVVCIQSFTS